MQYVRPSVESLRRVDMPFLFRVGLESEGLSSLPDIWGGSRDKVGPDSGVRFTSRSMRLSRLLCIGALMCLGGVSGAEPSAPTYSMDLACGANCLYTGLALFHIEPEYTDLLVKCVDRPDGSSIGALARVAREYGLHAEPLAKLRIDDLRACPYPAILHVRANTSELPYNHFELFVPSAADEGMLFDPPRAPRSVRTSDLDARWSGNAILLSNEPVSFGFLWRSGAARTSIIVVSVLAMFALLWSGQKLILRWARKGVAPVAVQAAWVCSVALLAASVGNAFVGGGLINRHDLIEGVMDAKFETFLPVLTADDVKAAMRKGDVIVDARLRPDYQAGHIDGALNIPVDTPQSEVSSTIMEAPLDARIIVYCQSARCPYAKTVAHRISQAGRANLALFKAGWEGWKKEG